LRVPPNSDKWILLNLQMQEKQKEHHENYDFRRKPRPW
jgi:hypothetical protein